jgi:flagellar protein FliO/FliZ
MVAGSLGLEGAAELASVVLIFIFVLALTYFTTRFVAGYQKTRLINGNIQVLEVQRISNGKYIQIVRIGKKYFAIAVCKDTVTCLGELDGDDLSVDDALTESHDHSFKAIFDVLRKDKPED